MKITELINLLGDVGKEEGDIQVRCGANRIMGLAVVKTEYPHYVSIIIVPGAHLKLLPGGGHRNET